MFKNKIIFLFALALMSGVLSVNTVFAKTSDAVKVTLNFEKNQFAYDENVPVNIAITNQSKSSVKILRWLTPFDGVKEDLFIVTVDGKPVEYIGAHYKRAAPTEKDYVTLKAGETFDSTVDLAGYYDLSQTGFYQVNYNVEAANIFSSKTTLLDQSEELKSSIAQAYIVGRETKIEVDAPDVVSGSTSYTGCTTSRQSSLLTARNDASTYSTNSFNYLNAGTVGARTRPGSAVIRRRVIRPFALIVQASVTRWIRRASILTAPAPTAHMPTFIRPSLITSIFATLSGTRPRPEPTPKPEHWFTR